MADEFNWQVRVYYEDTDAAGIVFYANYLRYMERARTEWLRNIDYEHAYLKNEHGVLFVVKNLNIDYLQPARLDDLLTVTSRLLSHRAASFIFRQTIKNADHTLLTTADVKVACLNAATLKAAALPAVLLRELANDG